MKLLCIPYLAKAGKLYSQIPESGAGDLDFTRVGDTATRVNEAGLIESVPANTPRIDFTGGGCGKLLLEPQRTNLALASEDFSNLTYWFPTNAAILANQTISPDGTQNADLALFESVASSINQGTVFAGNSDVTISVFVKANTISTFRIRESFYSGVSCVFDLSAQTAGAGGKLENYGNGWFRCSFTYNLGVGQTNINWDFDSNAAAGSLYLWGAQAELGSYATSYIPTLGASVTRGADLCSKTGISSLIGQTEGAIFVDVDLSKININEDRLFINAETDSGNRITLAIDSGNLLRCNFIDAGVLFAVTASPTWQLGRNKIAVAYANNDAVLFLNGNLVSTITTASIPSTTQIQLGNFQNSIAFLSDRISAAVLYTIRLSNAELAQLTTL